MANGLIPDTTDVEEEEEKGYIPPIPRTSLLTRDREERRPSTVPLSRKATESRTTHGKLRGLRGQPLRFKGLDREEVRTLPPSEDTQVGKYIPNIPDTDLSPHIIEPDPSIYNDVAIPNSEEGIAPKDVVNFLFGPEMGIIGMKLDNQGFSWDIENAKQQWSDAPLWSNLLATASLVGTIAFPAGRAFLNSLRFGKIGSVFGKFGDKALEVQKFKALKLIDEGIDANKVDDKTLQLLRKQEVDRARFSNYIARVDAAKRGELQLGPFERIKWEFDKRFANTYFNITNDAVEGTNYTRLYHDRLDQFWKAENIGRLFVNIPDEVAGPRIYQYWLARMGQANMPRLTAKERAWADMMGGLMRKHQDEALQAGLITPATYKKVGAMHIPALERGTPDLGIDVARTHLVPIRRKPTTGIEGIQQVTTPRKGIAKILGREKVTFEPSGQYEYIALQTYRMPRLDSPTLLERSKTLPEVAQRLKTGNLITDPADVTLRGYVMDRMLLENFKFVRDVALDPRYSIDAADLTSKFGAKAAASGKTIREMAEAAGYVSLDKIGDTQGNIIRRMLAKSGKEVEDLPWIRREIFEEVYGESGTFFQTQSAADMMELLTTMFKTAKTGLSVPTHMQNWVGNMGFLAQRGFNPLDPDNVELMSKMAGAFNKIAQLNTTARKAGINARSIFDDATGLLKGVDLGKVKVGGKTFDLTDELLDPMVRDLIEESAFQTVEGAAHIERLMGRLGRDRYMTRAVAQGYMKGKNLLQIKDRVKWFDTMTKWYLGEDMVPKMAYYLSLRSKGLSKAAAALETGKALPMYATVGSAVRYGRRWMWPWATFPTEAVRITKNNLMDHPIRMMPWLRLPQIMQTFVSGFGGGPTTPEAVEEGVRSLPIWAQKYSTVLMSGRTASGAGGGLTGGVLGGVAGGLLTRSAAGAYAGAALGGAGGAALASLMTTEEQGNRLRGAVLDWLPHTSFMLTTTSPEFGQKAAPGEGYKAALPFKDLQGALEQMPSMPLAILKPLLNVIEGKTAYGQEIGYEDTGDAVGKAIAGMIGFLAPPFIQKYGFKLTTPEISLSEAMFGAHVPGDITNVAKFMIDTGEVVDPNTKMTGSLTHDHFLQNLGVWRSYAADPEIRLSNEALTERHMGAIRSHLSRRLAFTLENGLDDESTKILAKINGTFVRQYTENPRLAQEKFHEWLQRRSTQIGRHPMLRKWSEDEILDRLRRTAKLAGEFRNQAREEVLGALRSELRIRRLNAEVRSGVIQRSGSNRRQGVVPRGRRREGVIPR